MKLKTNQGIIISILVLLFNLPCCKDLYGREQLAIADKGSYLADIISTLKTEWPTNRTVNIIAHGHSVPAGYFKTPIVNTFNAYPHLIHKALKAEYPYSVINVIVSAIGGENSLSGAKRFKEDVLSLKPDVILIDYALNDRGIGLESAEIAWREMIEKSLSSGAKVILLTPTGDTSAGMDDPDDLLNQHAKQIRNLAHEYQVGLVDSLQLFKQYIQQGGKLEDLMSQVNHPNLQGHQLVANELASWFKAE
ncbi:MAG: SGNH/GDSL hydrolase family protein [Candidatus Hinthialibacter antarcticus]|nr:SGNH/GDSL hydrolase family protein [Candidatus Hinthialibacter antarcticus]